MTPNKNGGQPGRKGNMNPINPSATIKMPRVISKILFVF